MKSNIKGVVTAMVTPFGENGEVNITETGRLAEWLAGKGVDALFVGGTTGEGLLLSCKERELLIETVVAAVKGRVRVLAQAGSITTEETIRLAKHAEKSGADGAAVISPFFYKFDKDAMVAHFTTVAAAVPGFPIFLYNIPGNAGNHLTAEIVEEIIQLSPNVCGIKDSSRDLVLLQELMKYASDDFCVMEGSDSVLLSGLLLGTPGCVSALSTAFPEAVIAVLKHAASGDLAAARKAQDLVIELSALLKTGPSPACYKVALEKRSFSMGGVRPPLRYFSAAEMKRFDEIFERIWTGD